MPSKKARKSTRHGATQPEAERTRKQVLLRLPPDLVAKLDAWDTPRSYLVEAALRLVLKSYETDEPINAGEDLPDMLTDLFDRDGAA